MILVLLYKFSESQDSVIGYKLCEKLVEEGFDLLVTSTSRNEEKQAETEAARRMTETLTGSVRIIETEPDVLDAPTQERIFNLHRTAIHDVIEAVIGTLPGTVQTAVELKKMLNLSLVLLAATKVSTTRESLKTELLRLVSFADEVWSVGSDTYLHYEEMFRGQRKKKRVAHKEILLRPQVSRDHQEFPIEGECGSLLSVWNHDNSYNIKDIKKSAKESTIESFLPVAAAIEKIHEQNLQGSMISLEWNIHGLLGKKKHVRQLQDPRHPHKFPINALESASSPHNISWSQCLAYIAPDVQDKSFNYFTLVALCVGVPTLVSEQSSVGQFLRGLKTPLSRKPIVKLTGDFEHDKEALFRKLQNEIFSKEAKPMKWAMELSEYLQTTDDLWKLDLSVLKPRPIPIAREEDLGLPAYLHRSAQQASLTGQVRGLTLLSNKDKVSRLSVESGLDLVPVHGHYHARTIEAKFPLPPSLFVQHMDNLQRPSRELVKASKSPVFPSPCYGEDLSPINYVNPGTKSSMVLEEHINCCSGRVNALLFGSLERPPEEEPLVTLKVFLLSVPSTRKSSRKILREIQEITDTETLNGRHQIDKMEMRISCYEYKPFESTIEIALTSGKWIPRPNSQNVKSKTLIDAIHYVDGHICKGKPREAHTFYMVPVDPATQHFRGDLKMTINTVYHELAGAQSLPAITASENDPVVIVVNIPQVKTTQSQADEKYPGMLTKKPMIPAVPFSGYSTRNSREEHDLKSLVRLGQDPNGNQNSLTDEIIGELASEIGNQDLIQIAVKMLGFKFAYIQSLKDRYRGNTWEFNVHILTEWRNRKPDNNIQKIDTILKEAAETSGLTDYADVSKILGTGTRPVAKSITSIDEDKSSPKWSSLPSELSHQILARIATLISPNEMETIALVYFEFSEPLLHHIKADELNNTMAVNRVILKRWSNRYGGEHRQRLAEIFLRAAEEGMVGKESAKRIVELLKSRDI